MSLAAPAPAGSSRTRVMIVDDSVVVRGLVARWVTDAGEFEVVGTAANGQMAIDALARVEPDIVLLDLEMPVMDGLTALPEMLRRRPGMKVVVISTLTRRNAEISLKCLSLGAIDYLPKPDGHRHVTTSTDFRRDLVSKLKGLAAARPRGPRPFGHVVPTETTPGPPVKLGSARPKCLLIGASTGGPRAVEEVLRGLGSALQQLPTLIVQHMPPVFTGVFAERLRTQVGIRACEPDQGEPLVAGTVYVAPGGRHMGLIVRLGDPAIRLDDGPPQNFCRPAVDVLFRDAAAIYGAGALAVVLTGMGSDGTEGARALVRAGGTVLAQDEATSTIWGMPGSVVRAGLAQDILPLQSIGPTLKGHITGSS